jgi:hypothetical protein
MSEWLYIVGSDVVNTCAINTPPAAVDVAQWIRMVSSNQHLRHSTPHFPKRHFISSAQSVWLKEKSEKAFVPAL